MPLDSLCIAALARELDTHASGMTADKIYQPLSDTVLLSLRGGKNSGKLLLCGGTGTARALYKVKV
jgi:predicted ribosome quality control (RQC) complex YloA/Tae2 family protein